MDRDIKDVRAKLAEITDAEFYSLVQVNEY